MYLLLRSSLYGNCFKGSIFTQIWYVGLVFIDHWTRWSEVLDILNRRLLETEWYSNYGIKYDLSVIVAIFFSR